MGSTADEVQPLQKPLWNEIGVPLEVSVGGQEVGSGGGTGGYGRGDRGRDGDRDRDDDRGGNERYGDNGHVPLAEGGGVYTGSLPGGLAGRIIHMAGGGSDPQGGRRLPRHWPSVYGVNSGEGDP